LLQQALVNPAIGLEGFIIERGQIETNKCYGSRALTKIKGTGILYKETMGIDDSPNKIEGTGTIGGKNLRIV
jgi:hypothetical protein